jgi:hypothetical protein
VVRDDQAARVEKVRTRMLEQKTERRLADRQDELDLAAEALAG